MKDKRKDLTLQECLDALRYAIDTVDIRGNLITAQSHLSTVAYFAEIASEKIIILRAKAD